MRWESVKISFTAAMALMASSVIFFIIFFVAVESIPALVKMGLGIFSSEWRPYQGKFGLLVFIVGTLCVSALALAVAVPLGILTAVYIAEYCREPLKSGLRMLFEIFAAFPSIVVGMWGYLVLVPIIRDVVAPLLGVQTRGYSVLAAGLALSLMLTPTIVVISERVLSLVPQELREAAYALGARKSQVTFRIVLPHAFPGICAAIFLAIGRALGETMVVLMVSGNSPKIPSSVFDSCYPLTALIANEFGFAAGFPLYRSALFAAALILLLTALIFVLAARLILRARVV